MRDERVAKLADLLVQYSVKVQPGDWCVIIGEEITRPLARELYRAVIEAGGQAATLLNDPELQVIRLLKASDEQLDFPSPIYKFIMEEADCLFSLEGSTNTRRLSNMDPVRVARNQRANKAAIETYFKRSGSGELRWVISRLPTQANAQEAEMSLTEYEDFVFSACLLNEPDPIAAWHDLRDKQQRIVEWLEGKETIKAEGPGVDLTVSVKGRPFVNADGTNNMPSGEVFTSPVEDSAHGRIAFSFPTILADRELDGVILEFQAGRVVKASAEKGEDFLLSQIDQDEGARVMGEFAIGTNYAIDRFSGDTLFDEKIGGTMHIALGQGIEEAGGVNESIIHWDMVTDMKQDSRISADGEVFYENGKFKI